MKDPTLNLCAQDQLMHHILVLQLHMLWSRVPIDPKRNWTHFPLTKLFLSRKKKNRTTWPSQNHRKKQNPFQPYLQPTKNPNHGVYIATHHKPSHPPWCCSKQKNQILRSCACANRSERFENSKNFRAKMPPKMEIFFSWANYLL